VCARIARDDFEGTHHFVVLVFEDAAVPGVLSGEVAELDGDANRLVGIDADGVLSHSLVWSGRVGSVRTAADHAELDQVEVKVPLLAV